MKIFSKIHCTLLLLFLFQMKIYTEPFPISFAIPECKVVKEIPTKDQDFGHVIPGDLSTYTFSTEAEYYKDYQRSYFGVTRKKAGWDCMRHYEILANGAIPYFINLDDCDNKTMHLLPRKLIKEAMNLEGVSYLQIDHSKFDKKRYYEILEELLEYTRKHLTTRQMARYLLETIHYQGNGNILYLSQTTAPDYMRSLILTGLKEIYENKVVDVPKIDYIYKNFSPYIAMYGGGMSYTRNIEDLPVNRENIEERIKKREFDLVIYGSVHRGMPFYELVLENYKPSEIAYICGEDYHHCNLKHLPNFFLREFEGN